MSNEFIKAADDARRLLRGFRAFEEVAAALAKTGEIVQARAEAETALAALQPQIAEARAAVSEAMAQADKILADAREEGERITGAAGAKALVLVADAETSAQNIVFEAEGVKVKAEELRAVAHKEAADALDKRDLLAAEVKDLEARAEKARAYLAKLAG